MKGRRASYLHPVRMYVFTSAIFFLIFFIIYHPEKPIVVNEQPLGYQERMEKIKDLENELKQKRRNSAILIKEIQLLRDTAHIVTDLDLLKASRQNVMWQVSGSNYKTTREYDSMQNSLPPGKKDGWLLRAMVKRQIQLKTKYKDNPSEVSSNLLEIFLHKLPYLLFLSLPLFALSLKLFYIRRKQFFYADHAIFSIHHYIFSFILLLCVFLLGAARDYPGFHWLEVIEIILVIAWPVHLYIAMLNFYKQGWFKTFVKFSLLNIFGLFTLLILFVVFFVLSIFQL